MKTISDEKQPKRRKNEKKNVQKKSLGIKEEIINHSNTGFGLFEPRIVCQEDIPAN